ncbi:MAG: hypothetical protein QM820_39435 [Minicystis sp.]
MYTPPEVLPRPKPLPKLASTLEEKDGIVAHVTLDSLHADVARCTLTVPAPLGAIGPTVRER